MITKINVMDEKNAPLLVNELKDNLECLKNVTIEKVRDEMECLNIRIDELEAVNSSTMDNYIFNGTFEGGFYELVGMIPPDNIDTAEAKRLLFDNMGNFAVIMECDKSQKNMDLMDKTVRNVSIVYYPLDEYYDGITPDDMQLSTHF